MSQSKLPERKLINLSDSIQSIQAQKQYRTNKKFISFMRQKKSVNKSVTCLVSSVVSVIAPNGSREQWKKKGHRSFGGQPFRTSSRKNKRIVQFYFVCFLFFLRDVNDVLLLQEKINISDWQAHYLCLSNGFCLTSVTTTDGNASLISQSVAALSFLIRLSHIYKIILSPPQKKIIIILNCPSDMLTDNQKPQRVSLLHDTWWRRVSNRLLLFSVREEQINFLPPHQR